MKKTLLKIFGLLILVAYNLISLHGQELVKYEFENNIFDTSGNNRNLSAVTSTPNLTYCNDAAKGIVAEFNATTNVLNVADWIPVEGSGPRTVMMFVNTITNTTPLCAWGSLAAGGKFFVQVNNRTLRIDVGNSDIVGTTNIADGKWHHIAIVIPDKAGCTTEDVIFYIDGVKEDVVVKAVISIDTKNSYNFKLASNHTAKQKFEGSIDDFIIYDRALSQTEIQEHVGTQTATEEFISQDSKLLYFSKNQETKDVPVLLPFQDSDIRIVNSNSWLNIQKVSSEQKLVFTVEESTSEDVRVAEFTIARGNVVENCRVEQFGTGKNLAVNLSEVSVDYRQHNTQIEVVSNEEVNYTLSNNWIIFKEKITDGTKTIFTFQINELEEANPRTSSISFYTTNEANKVEVIVNQILLTDESYKAMDPDFSPNVEIPIVSGTLNPGDCFQDGQNIENTFDDDVSTLYHSPWDGYTPATVELIYDLEDAPNQLEYILLTPRANKTNGIIKTGNIYVQTKSNTEWTNVGEINLEVSNSTQRVDLSSVQTNVTKVKIEVTGTEHSNPDKWLCSLAEIKFCASSGVDSEALASELFTTRLCNELKPDVTFDYIKNHPNKFLKNIALHILNKTYELDKRVFAAAPYQPNEDIKRLFKVSTHSQHSNPTGFFFQSGETVVIMLDKDYGTSVNCELIEYTETQNSTKKQIVSLKPGINSFTATVSGLCYIQYYTPDYNTADDIVINLASGTYNGLFDIEKHSNTDGPEILSNTVTNTLDLVGKYTQCAFDVEGLTKHAQSTLKDLLNVYDGIILDQYTTMGLVKTNRIPKSKVYNRWKPSGNPSAGGEGASYPKGLSYKYCSAQYLLNDCWLVAHETGHVNQVRDAMKWVGLTEVTNNLYCLTTQLRTSPDAIRLDHKFEGKTRFGNYYNNFFQESLIYKHEFGCQGAYWGQEYGPYFNDKVNAEVWGSNNWMKLIPFFQLKLYLEIVGCDKPWGKPDFYADIYTKGIAFDENQPVNQGVFQMEFIKNACDVAQMDLIDYFEQTCWLIEIDKYIGDYTPKVKTITGQMIDELKAYVASKNYPKPLSPVIYFLTAKNAPYFINEKPVTGIKNEGVTDGPVYNGLTQKRIDAREWKNVVAFKTYENDEVTHYTTVFTNSENNEFTDVYYTETSTKITAVAWDGTETTVHENATITAIGNKSKKIESQEWVWLSYSNNSLTVHLSENIQASVSIYNISGQIVKRIDKVVSEKMINLSGYKGAFIVSVQDNKGRYYTKNIVM